MQENNPFKTNYYASNTYANSRFVIENNDLKINGIGWEKISALPNNDNSIKEKLANHEQEKATKFIANLADGTHHKLSYEDRLKNANIEIGQLEKNNKLQYQKIVNQTDDWLIMLEKWVVENRAIKQEANEYAPELTELERINESLINKRENPLWYDSIIDQGFYLFSEWVCEFIKSSPNDPYYQYINNAYRSDLDYYHGIDSYYGHEESIQNGMDANKKKEIALKKNIQIQWIRLSSNNPKKYHELTTKMSHIKNVQIKLEQLKKENLAEYKKLIERTRNFIDNKISALNKKLENEKIATEADIKKYSEARKLDEKKSWMKEKLAEEKAKLENAIEFMTESSEYYGREKEKPFYARRENAEKKLTALKIENKKKYDEILHQASSWKQQ
ncbi:hypothetical protein [Rickettsiella endosymbiont of Rhagonycha lignosa]|uniref:hypothetical protein n=1 Tax=Rickettsiella endosymbiont of Rhagonycha lignosa TaxID=3077937 RepID=UPI00313AAD44